MSPIPQRYNLKAIHNKNRRTALEAIGVTNTSKIQSESNSQPLCSDTYLLSGCHQYLKDTIWKQFTTKLMLFLFSLRCHQYLKDTIWKQFTTNLLTPTYTYWCHQYLKDTIWKQFTTKKLFNLFFFGVSPIPQRYNLKAIHNRCISNSFAAFGVTNTSKIQSESNSQRYAFPACKALGCHQYLKDTIWKQFTTISRR